MAEHCNYQSPELIKKMYIAFGKYIIKELRQNGEAELPNIGTFYLRQYAERVGKNVNTGELSVYPDCMVVKFKPCRNLKAVFNPKLRE